MSFKNKREMQHLTGAPKQNLLLSTYIQLVIHFVSFISTALQFFRK